MYLYLRYISEVSSPTLASVHAPSQSLDALNLRNSNVCIMKGQYITLLRWRLLIMSYDLRLVHVGLNHGLLLPSLVQKLRSTSQSLGPEPILYSADILILSEFDRSIG